MPCMIGGDVRARDPSPRETLEGARPRVPGKRVKTLEYAMAPDYATRWASRKTDREHASPPCLTSRRSTAIEHPMSAYLIFTREKTIDRAELEIYWAKITATFEGHPIRVLAAYGPHEVLEGPATEGVVIAEFPDIEAVKKWYDSPAYQAIRVHRQNGAVYRGIVVAGV
jgi:uncharacterized protein (DUF1330 family)